MKTNWPAYRLAYLLLVSAALIASPMNARPGPPAPLVRVDAQVTAQTVRLETKASGPFEYTTYRPSEHLLVVDLLGVTATESTGAQVLKSDLVSSYRVLQYRAGETASVRLEVLMRTPVEPRIERQGPDQLTLIFESPASPVADRATEPPSARAASRASPATLIAQVEIGRTGEQTSVRVEGNGRLAYEATRLSNPARLVLDFSGAQMGIARTSIPSDAKPVRGIRLGQFQPDVARVVIDLERPVRYSVKAEGKTLTVAFDAPVAAPASKPVAPEKAEETDKQAAATKPAETGQPSAGPLAADSSKMSLPDTLTQPLAALASPAAKVEPSTAATPQAAPAATQAPAGPAQAGGKYTGEPISVNLKDVDLKDFFRLIHEISGLNVVLDPAVKGSLTLVLDDVPWDQALDIVLRNNNLDKQLDGNVLRVATRDTLKKEAETQRDLAKAQAEAVEQVTATRVISYTKASALRDTLKKFLSSRGEILADERSNTLIIKDIPSVLPAIDNLIRQLDRKAQQVEIEARVVAASRSFARDIGSQFGFATTATSGRTLFGGVVGQPGFTSGVITGTGLPLPPLVTTSSSTTGASLPLNSNLPAGSPTSGITFAHRSPNVALDYIITAAESKGVGKLLSKPKVITQNNEKATVKQGTKIPIQTTINNTISVQFIDAVLKLEVTPQITAEGTVFMEVVVENTQIDAGIPRVQGIPALNTQSAETKVLINDGGTVVVGGVIISSQRTDITQVPLIGSIPLIGNLFKRTNISVTSQELLFFLTPRIVPS